MPQKCRASSETAARSTCGHSAEWVATKTQRPFPLFKPDINGGSALRVLPSGTAVWRSHALQSTAHGAWLSLTQMRPGRRWLIRSLPKSSIPTTSFRGYYLYNTSPVNRGSIPFTTLWTLWRIKVLLRSKIRRFWSFNNATHSCFIKCL